MEEAAHRFGIDSPNCVKPKGVANGAMILQKLALFEHHLSLNDKFLSHEENRCPGTSNCQENII